MGSESNSDIFEKSIPPMGFKDSQIEIGIKGNFANFFRLLIMTPPLSLAKPFHNKVENSGSGDHPDMEKGESLLPADLHF